MLFGMCFAPDGGRVLTACRDGQASLWDWQSGDLVCSPGRPAGTGAGRQDQGEDGQVLEPATQEILLRTNRPGTIT